MTTEASDLAVHGYLVVRKPQLSFDEAQRGAFRGGPPCKGGLCYSGVDRMPWFDVDEALYDSTIPPEMRRLRMKVQEANGDTTGLELCGSKEDALQLLRFSNRIEERNELVAVSSGELARVKGLTDQADSSVNWLGYDVILKGGWSLIGDWLFRSPGALSEWLENLNSHGLLDSPYAETDLVRAYERAAQRGETEEIPGPEYSPILVGVGRVEVGRNRT